MYAWVCVHAPVCVCVSVYDAHLLIHLQMCTTPMWLPPMHQYFIVLNVMCLLLAVLTSTAAH